MCYVVPNAQIMQQKFLLIKCHMWPQNDVVLGFLLVTMKLFRDFLHNNTYVCLHMKKVIFS